MEIFTGNFTLRESRSHMRILIILSTCPMRQAIASYTEYTILYSSPIRNSSTYLSTIQLCNCSTMIIFVCLLNDIHGAVKHEETKDARFSRKTPCRILKHLFKHVRMFGSCYTEDRAFLTRFAMYVDH